MGNSKGRDNVKKRANRRKKTERLAVAAQLGSHQPAAEHPAPGGTVPPCGAARRSGPKAVSS